MLTRIAKIRAIIVDICNSPIKNKDQIGNAINNTAKPIVIPLANLSSEALNTIL
jgi:hypothetical protein